MSEEGFRDPPSPEPTKELSGAFSAPPAPAPDDRSTVMPDGGVRYFLRHPVQVSMRGRMSEVTEIVCRRPNGGDILAVGNPVIFDPARAQITHDHVRMPDMIFRLSGVTPATLNKLTSEDLLGIFWSVTAFFLPPVGAV